MSSVRTQDTALELRVRKCLHAAGFRYRVNVRTMIGKPDIVLPRHKMVVFVHGCFWHGHNCPRGQLPKTNTEFWSEKIERNKDRDRLVEEELERQGWSVRTVWQCDINRATSELIDELSLNILPSGGRMGA